MEWQMKSIILLCVFGLFFNARTKSKIIQTNSLNTSLNSVEKLLKFNSKTCLIIEINYCLCVFKNKNLRYSNLKLLAKKAKEKGVNWNMMFSEYCRVEESTYAEDGFKEILRQAQLQKSIILGFNTSSCAISFADAAFLTKNIFKKITNQNYIDDGMFNLKKVAYFIDFISFLKESGVEKIILISNSKKLLEMAEKSCCELGVDFLGIEYSGAIYGGSNAEEVDTMIDAHIKKKQKLGVLQ